MPKTKYCRCCDTTKPVSEFYKNKRLEFEIDRYCKVCKDHKKARYHKNNPEKVKIANRKRVLARNYGLSLEEYTQILEDQGYRCAICRETLEFRKGRYAVDHNHETSEVRGVLCHPCNSGIGLLKDSPLILKLATEYLETNGHYGPKATCSSQAAL